MKFVFTTIISLFLLYSYSQTNTLNKKVEQLFAQQKVEEAGNTLSKNGAKYQHNVNKEVSVVQSIIKTRTKDQNKDQSISR